MVDGEPPPVLGLGFRALGAPVPVALANLFLEALPSWDVWGNDAFSILRVVCAGIVGVLTATRAENESVTGSMQSLDRSPAGGAGEREPART